MKNRAPKPRIMLVDDDPDFLKAVKLMLEDRYEVYSFTDGDELLEQLDALTPDLLILDVHMPREDGFSLCRRVRADRRFASLPVLFLTASREDEDFLSLLQAGGDAYLNKPIGRERLHARIRESLFDAAAAPRSRGG